MVDIARHGAKVRVSAAHRQGSADNLELALEGARQEVPIYGSTAAAARSAKW